MSTINEMNKRSSEILRVVIDSYIETGEPIGSKTIAQQLTKSLSPATIRNIMSDLEDAGLLYSPHISAGRLPTEAGLRLFVDGILEVAQESEHPRSYEVAGQILKSVSELNSQLIDLQKSMADLEATKRKGNTTKVTNALFVGSTKDLQKLLKNGGND